MNRNLHRTIAILSVIACQTALAGDDPRIVQSKKLTASLQQQLGHALKTALQTKEPVHAIGVCKLEAPDIALALSQNSNARVGRTALKVRNPNNRPDSAEGEILQVFKTAIEQGEFPTEMMHFSANPDGSALFMQPIVMQPVCTVCHGTNIAEPIRQTLEEAYPNDQATGFTEGSLRGAFTVRWPATETTSP